MTPRTPLARRTFLRGALGGGAAVSVALPLLDAMVPTRRAPAPPLSEPIFGVFYWATACRGTSATARPRAEAVTPTCGPPAPSAPPGPAILARAAEKTGLLQPVLERLLGRGHGGRWAMTKLLVPSAAASAFLNNTPIVAMMIPQILRWADRVRESASRYLMPMSFAVVLGGVITTIGTSTNLVVSRLLHQAGGAPLGLFEITPVGLPVAIVGLMTMIITVPWLQPDRLPTRGQLEESVREFTVTMTVVPGGPLEGVEVEAGDLRLNGWHFDLGDGVLTMLDESSNQAPAPLLLLSVPGKLAPRPTSAPNSRNTGVGASHLSCRPSSR